MIRFDAILWDDAADPTGNVRHVAAHGVTPAEVESVLRNANAEDGVSRTTGRKMAFGWTDTGKFLAVAYTVKQTRSTVALYPVTAYPVDPY